jgi:hypothetical protein
MVLTVIRKKEKAGKMRPFSTCFMKDWRKHRRAHHRECGARVGGGAIEAADWRAPERDECAEV